MEIKEVKNNVGGVTRSSSINLKTIDNEIASISGRSSSTPISMESLWNEVQNLKSNSKKVTVFDLSKIPAQSIKNGLNLNISNYVNHTITSKTLVVVSGTFTMYNGWDGSCSNKNFSFNGSNFNCVSNLGNHRTSGGIKLINKILYLWSDGSSTYNIMMKQTGTIVLVDL